jgi:hypothetical protein
MFVVFPHLPFNSILEASYIIRARRRSRQYYTLTDLEGTRTNTALAIGTTMIQLHFTRNKFAAPQSRASAFNDNVHLLNVLDILLQGLFRDGGLSRKGRFCQPELRSLGRILVDVVTRLSSSNFVRRCRWRSVL